MTGATTPALFTIGHGADDRPALAARLQDAGVTTLVDVRRFPGSRRNPDVGTDALALWLPEIEIAYRWEERLGGRRRLAPGEAGRDPWWRVESFAAYAAHTRTDEFKAAMDALLDGLAGGRTAVMCSENVWWRCHRRLVADVAVLVHGVAVTHLMPAGRTAAHQPSDGARQVGPDELVWDGGPADAPDR